MSFWDEQALPVLRAIATSQDQHIRDGMLFLGMGNRGAKALALDFDDDHIHQALLALADEDYLDLGNVSYSSGPGATLTGLRVTGRGQQILGQWPQFEAIVTPSTLSALLERTAEYAPDGEQATRLRRASQILRQHTRPTLMAAAASFGGQALRASLGLP